MTELIDSFSQLGGIYLGIEQQFQRITYRDLLVEAEQELARQHEERWPLAISPHGVPWQPLAPATIAKKGHSTILVDTGRLQASVVNPQHPDHVRELLDNGLTFGTDVPYGIFHQDGTPRLPQREFLGMTIETVDQITSNVADHAVQGLLRSY